MDWTEIVSLGSIVLGALCVIIALLVVITTPNKKSKKKKSKSKMLALGVFGCLLIGGGLFTCYQEAMDLAVKDAEKISDGYYMVRDYEKMLKELQDKDSDHEQITLNMAPLISKLSNYQTEKASTVSTKKGQEMINQYYKAIGRLGSNSYMENNMAESPLIIETYLDDIKTIKGYEKEVIDYFKIDESALEAHL